VEFQQQCEKLCAAKSISFTNLSGFLQDNEFADSAHATYKGQQRLHRVLLEMALEHLSNTDIQ
jgi:hypothetical protein